MTQEAPTTFFDMQPTAAPAQTLPVALEDACQASLEELQAALRRANQRLVEQQAILNARTQALQEIATELATLVACHMRADAKGLIAHLQRLVKDRVKVTAATPGTVQ